MNKIIDQFILRLLLQLSMPALNKAAQRSARFRELLDEPPFVFQIATRSGAAGFYALRDKRLRIGFGMHDTPDMSQTWQSGPVAARVMMNADDSEMLRAMEDGRVRIRGNFAVALWFNEAMKIARTKPASHSREVTR